MNGYLLDTHVVLWWLSDPGRLSEAARAAIADGTNRVYVSAAAAWEMAIKKSLGRLDIPGNLAEALADDDIAVLDVSLDHALAVADLPMIHQDPFDRMQIVQAHHENLTLVTRDQRILRYGVSYLPA
jgi:PIN domain nuclease of toxin-antitoxin system